MESPTQIDLTRELRDHIADLLAAEIPSGSDASVETLDENGVLKVLVIDNDANIFRVTVEQI